MTDDVFADFVLQTNKYAALSDDLPPKSRFMQWQDDGISITDLETFIALAFYFGVEKKENVERYWSTHSVYS